MLVTEQVEAHVTAFGEAVATGRWAAFAERFAVDAEMEFVGVPVGPFSGRAAIAAAYEADPPREALEVLSPVTTDGGDAVVAFRWVDSGGTGTMRLRFGTTGAVERLVVAFDR